MLELLTPVMSVTVMIFSLAWEELWLVLPGSPYFETAERTLLTSLVIAAGALIAFLMVWAEYQVRVWAAVLRVRADGREPRTGAGRARRSGWWRRGRWQSVEKSAGGGVVVRCRSGKYASAS